MTVFFQCITENLTNTKMRFSADECMSQSSVTCAYTETCLQSGQKTVALEMYTSMTNQ